eukprot:602366-Rhodomonas_salina.2
MSSKRFTEGRAGTASGAGGTPRPIRARQAWPLAFKFRIEFRWGRVSDMRLRAPGSFSELDWREGGRDTPLLRKPRSPRTSEPLRAGHTHVSMSCGLSGYAYGERFPHKQHQSCTGAKARGERGTGPPRSPTALACGYGSRIRSASVSRVSERLKRAEMRRASTRCEQQTSPERLTRARSNQCGGGGKRGARS